MNVSTQQQDGGAPLRDQGGTIATAIVQVFREHTGRGPTRARATVMDDSVAVLLGGLLTRSELTLVGRGMRESVAALRRDYRAAMSDDLKQVISAVLERPVLAVLGDEDLEHDAAALVFLLAAGD